MTRRLADPSFRLPTTARFWQACCAVMVLSCLSSSSHADDAERLYRQIKWKYGPTTIRIGDNAEMKIPKGYKYTGREGAAIWNKLTMNPPQDDLGVLVSTNDNADWYVVFMFDQCGYVKDDEKESLDAKQILAAIQEGNKEGNAYRRSKGWTEINILGWSETPTYDEETHNLVWCALGQDSEGMTVINHNTRILGRRGVMNVMLVADPQDTGRVAATIKEMMNGFRYRQGEKYAEWQQGDKIAAYGLTGLIVGGGLVAAAKTGLLQMLLKGGKAIVLLVAGGVAAFWKMLTGQGSGHNSYS
ncbi:MAG: DUF2167 domain-containing protein [Planctomycetota bacterium]|nr:DUF2167 domain-containing protein [Planctomycetota bacterium]